MKIFQFENWDQLGVNEEVMPNDGERTTCMMHKGKMVFNDEAFPGIGERVLCMTHEHDFAR